MKRLYVLFLLSSVAGLCQAQSTHDFLVAGGVDVIKTDIKKPFDKGQVGIDLNYFVVRHFSVGGGAEFWTQQGSFVMGMRWYADDKFFFRFRGLIGVNDASLGIGWSKPIAPKLRFEAIGDYYFRGQFALRGGLSYVIR